MADEVKTVKVKLKARGWVNGQVREEGETVDLPEKADDGGDFAILFGEIVKENNPTKPKPETPAAN